MKTAFFAVLCLVSVVAMAEEEFDQKKWAECMSMAESQTRREFSKEFIVHAPGWEPGKGVSFFAWDVKGGDFYMKFDSSGRLVKVAPEDEYPELVKFKERRKALVRQFREEYAKSLGLTVEEAEKRYRNRSRELSIDGGRRKNEKEREAEEREARALILPKIEEVIGFKFGQEPIAGVEIKTNSFRCGSSASVRQVVKLSKPFRHMKEVELNYAENKLFSARLLVNFGLEFSEESKELELAEIKKELAGRLGLEFSHTMNFKSLFSGGVAVVNAQRGNIQVKVRSASDGLALEFQDSQTLHEANEISRKRGREIPSLPDGK